MLCCSLSFTFSSCLDLTPKEDLSDSSLWTKPADYKLFANQFYSWLRSFPSVTSDGPHSDYRSDLISSDTRNIYSNGTNPMPTTDGNFTTAYSRLRQINTMLTKAEAYPSQSDIAQAVGEAKFFRAYVYFDLLQLYGDALIVTAPLDITDPALHAKRNSRTEVTDFIISYLTDAISLLTPYKSLSGSARVSVEAAQAFLSRVALYEGTWQKFRMGDAARSTALLTTARDAAQAVIKSGAFSLFKPEALGTSAYKYLFTLENTKCNPAGATKSDNHEYILKKEYDTDITGGSIGSSPGSAFIGKTSFVTRKFANMFLTKDGLPIDETDKTRFATTTSEYADRDNRMTNILIVPGSPVYTSAKGRKSWQDDATDLALALYKSFEPYNNSGYFSQKWNAERQISGTYPGFDYPVIRYAEVLLNYAEAVFELCETAGNTASKDVTDALNISLNLVRKRVNPNMPSLTVDFVKNHGLDMRTEIHRERTIELFHEGFRIDDLKRWNTAAQEMPQDMLGVMYTGTEYVKKWPGMPRGTNADGCILMETNRKWEEKNYLYPIPTEQLQLHPELGQNPGWPNVTSQKK